jgi:polyphosphate kinase
MVVGVGRRPRNAPVRIEVERGMPALVREMLQRELRFERRGVVVTLGESDVYEVDGLLDWTCLKVLADRAPASEQFAPFESRKPFPEDRTVFELIDECDRLVHHPFEDFDSTVGRLLREAAADPDVVAIKMTLYRTGDRSPVADALVDAARQGKEVSVFVELKARFDEARNARWVKRLEEARVHVVYGLVGLKNHAKVLLVLRDSDDGLRRYAHIGTGNYNAGTSRVYTDLGLFTANPKITADLVDLFNELTGSSGAPAGTFKTLLVSPGGTVRELIRRIEREIEFVQTGKGGRIRIQVNGVEDPEVVDALYRASRAGVEIDLVVRGLCVLRPGVEGLSERIRVRSILGRFLEHQRIFHFGNGGNDEYLIGSADLRPRNLRRRVEVVTPVERPELKARLDRILTALLAEPSAWILTPEGQYLRNRAPGADQPHVHALLLEKSTAAEPEAAGA